MLPPTGVTFPKDSPWSALIKGLRLAGHEVEGFGYAAIRPDAIVTLNHQPEARWIQETYSLGPERSVLVVLEPRVTAPAMYTARTLKRYGHRFAASPIWARAIGGVPFLWPQDLTPRGVENPSHEYRATVINGDKRSAIKGSLYGLRRSVIRACDDSEVPLAVFGPGWNQSVAHRSIAGAKASAKALTALAVPRLGEAFSDLTSLPHNWLGTVQEKSAAFQHAPATVIIENCRDYVSEKLIDAVCAGVAPLYVGPSLRDFDLPDDIAISCSPTATGILKTIVNITYSRIDEVKMAGTAWLHTREAQAHDRAKVMSTLATEINSSLIS